ncbi:MAG: glycosyltransferase family 4 protein [Clostridia bacterium]|nr:glycosyltransferase family 4 protein [Clostridia bacterium]
MKIGIFTDAYHPVTSGVVTSIKMVEEEMKKRGHEVFIFAPSKHEPTENENLYMLKSMPLFVAKEYKNRVATFYSRTVAKEIKEIGLDIVHTQDEFSLGLFGKIIARKFGIPFIHTYHTMWEDYLHYIIPIKGTRNIYPKRFARVFSKNFARKAECIIAPSKKTEKYLKYRCKIKNKPIYIIPTGINIDPFNPKNFSENDKAELKKSLGINKDDKVILFIGRVAEEKSIHVILNNLSEVFNTVPNCKMLIVGDGPAKSSLEELAVKLNIKDKVIFAGKQVWEKIALYYSIGDVFVNASLTETQGLTFIEAMAAGVPIVAKYAPNLSEFIINNENGILVKYDNQISKAIINILSDYKLRQKLVSRAYVTATEHSSKEFGDKLEQVYMHVVENYKKDKEKRKGKKRLSITDALLKYI